MISLLWHFRASSAARGRGEFRERTARTLKVPSELGAIGGQSVCLHFAFLLTPQTSVCRYPPHVPRLKRRFDLLIP